MPDCPSLLQSLRRSLVVLVVSSSLCAQQAQQSAPAIPPPTIRVTTHMVLVDAVVTDKQGKAIPGLHPEDFVIEENGKAQKVSSLTTTVETTPGAAAARLEPPAVVGHSGSQQPGDDQ